MNRVSRRFWRVAFATLGSGAVLPVVMAQTPVTNKGQTSRTGKTSFVLPNALDVITDGLRLVPPGGSIGYITGGATAPDGRLIVTRGTDNSALVWEAATGRLVRRLSAYNRVTLIHLLPDGNRVLIGDADSNLVLWNITTGKQIYAATPRPAEFEGRSELHAMAVRADGKVAAVSWRRDTQGVTYTSLHLFSTETGKITLLRDYFVPGAMCFAPDGNLLVEDEYSLRNGAAADLLVLDSLTGKTLRTIKEAGSPAGFSADKKRVYTSYSYRAAEEKMRSKVLAFEWETGVKVKEVADLERGLIQLSPDGTRFASFWDGVQEFSTETGARLNSISVGAEELRGTTYTYKNELLVGVGTGEGRVVRYKSGTRNGVLGGGAESVPVSALSADGHVAYLVAKEGGGSRILRWDVLRNLPAGPPLAASDTLQSEPMLSPRNEFVAARGSNSATLLWNIKTGVLVGSFPGFDASSVIRKPAFSPDEKVLALPSDVRQSEEFFEYSTTTGQKLRAFSHPKLMDGYTSIVETLLYLPDGKRVLAGDVQGRIWVYDRAGARPLGHGVIHDRSALEGVVSRTTSATSHGPAYSLVPVPGDANRIVFAAFKGYSGEYDIAANRVTRVFTAFGASDATGIACSPDGTTVAIGNADGSIRLFDRATGKQTGQLTGHSGGVFDLVFSLNGTRLTSRGADGTIRFFNVPQRQEILTTLVFAPYNEAKQAYVTPDWITYNRTGFFEGSEGATRRIHFADGAKTFGADQFYERFYRAGLLASALNDTGNAPLPLPSGPNASNAIHTGAPPLVKIVSPQQGQTAKAGTVEVMIEVAEQAKGGVKAIRLYHNGRLVGGPSSVRGITVEAVVGSAITKKFTVALESGANELKAVAYSNTDLESVPAVVNVNFARAAIAKPVLHIFTVGINTYKDATMNLAYARPDAEAIADLFDGAKGGKGAGNLFANVRVMRLMDTEATGAAILASVTALSNTAKPEDVVFIYLAGHGETAGNTWYFLPSEMRQMALTERVKEFGIPWSRIETAIAKIPARKIVLVLDACKSGAIVDGVRGGMGEQQALAIMARAQGIHILTASNSQQYAGEVKALGHGILTYALLEGLNGKAGQTGDAAIMVRDVLTYVENRVPELSLKYRGEEQFPTPLARGQNFPVAAKP